jgi:predicted phage-related endonuclease
MTALGTMAPAPGTAEWQRIGTASKVAAIVGLSRWESPRSIWHVLRGEVPADDGNNAEAKARGHYLEPGILAWWRDRHPEYTWAIPQHYATRDDLPWAAATPDLACWRDGYQAAAGNTPEVVVDAKTQRDDEDWGAPGTDEMPPHIAVQLTWQMHLSGARRAYVALLTAFLDLREYVLDYDPEVGAWLEQSARQFYDDAMAGTTPPAVDGSKATWDVMRRLHPDIDATADAQLDADLAARFLAAKAATAAAEAAEREAKSAVLEAMGSARLAKHGDVIVARRQANRSGVSLVQVAKTLPAA